MPLELWITNTSPLIALAKAGRLELLTDTTRQVLVPDIVAREVLRGPDDDPARQTLLGGWGVPIAVPVIPPRVQALSLDAGETAVLAAALARPGATVVLDDGSARRKAQRSGFKVIGSLGVVLRARREGRIAAAAPVLHALQDIGLYFDDELIRGALVPFGEAWL